MDKGFGQLIMYESGLCFVVHIFSLFFLFSSYNIFAKYNIGYLIFILMMAAMQVFVTVRFCFLFARGARMCQAMREAKTGFQVWRMRMGKD